VSPAPAPASEPRPRRDRLAEPGRKRPERRQRDRAESPRRQAVEGRKRQRPQPTRAQVQPGVQGPRNGRPRAAHDGAAAKSRGLFWPTAKAGFAITVVLGIDAAVGSLLGLPVPGIDARSDRASLANSASLFGIDAGTPPGLSSGYVFPVIGPHDLGDEQARFGALRYAHVHEGQDIFGKLGAPEVAVHDGVVVDRGKDASRYSGGRGNYLVIYSPADNHSFVYMHMLKPSAMQFGDQVHAGQRVGQLGCSGSCDGPHLHFEVRIGKATLRSETKPVDPLPYLRQWPQTTPG
jgi:murein DD-endopeptidase MepM/ murein hydrolase activator NlpD